MKVSIIIPIYNASKYLVRCLDSVVAQTFCELECILVDDCGKDDSVAIAEKYIQEYNGPICFHLLHHDSNKATLPTIVRLLRWEFHSTPKHEPSIAGLQKNRNRL